MERNEYQKQINPIGTQFKAVRIVAAINLPNFFYPRQQVLPAENIQSLPTAARANISNVISTISTSLRRNAFAGWTDGYITSAVL